MKITKRQLRRIIRELGEKSWEKKQDTPGRARSEDLASAVDLEPDNPDRPDEDLQYVRNLDDGGLYRLPASVAKEIDVAKRDPWKKKKLIDALGQWASVNKLLGTSNWEWSGAQGAEYGALNAQRSAQQQSTSSQPTTTPQLGAVVSGKVEVEWDLGDTEFEDMPYEQGIRAAGLPAVVKLPGEFEEDELTDWLSDEYGFTHFGWEPIRESRMRITKRQLRRIIKEEKAKLLQEMQGPEPRGRIADNITARVELQNGTQTSVEIPYYIIEDAIADGLSWDGTFVEIEEYIDNYTGWPIGSWQFSQETLDAIRELVP